MWNCGALSLHLTTGESMNLLWPSKCASMLFYFFFMLMYSGGLEENNAPVYGRQVSWLLDGARAIPFSD